MQRALSILISISPRVAELNDSYHLTKQHIRSLQWTTNMGVTVRRKLTPMQKKKLTGLFRRKTSLVKQIGEAVALLSG